MIKIAPLCSSSKGNATFIGNCDGGILIDIGCSFRALKAGLEGFGLGLESVKAVLITHEHSDHIKGLFQLTKHTNIPIFASQGTMDYMLSHQCISTGSRVYTTQYLDKVPMDVQVHSFPTSHDSAESVGYTMMLHNKKISFCTDLGVITDVVRENIIRSHAVFLESNYDHTLLRTNRRYPEYLKRRIASNVGHLSNKDSSEFLPALVKSGTTHLVLGHLSQENNTPQTAYQQAIQTLSEKGMELNKDFTLNIAPVHCTGECICL